VQTMCSEDAVISARCGHADRNMARRMPVSLVTVQKEAHLSRGAALDRSCSGLDSSSGSSSFL
jgi:hypothetical protein